MKLLIEISNFSKYVKFMLD